LDPKPQSTDESITVPLMEESLDARVVENRQGSVRIHKHVETHPVQESVQLNHRDVTVERLEKNEVASERLKPWHEDGSLMIPVYEEELVTEIRLVLREVIRVTQNVRTETVAVEGDVRREVVEIEQVED
jgi:stress response protein YsnF